MQIALSWPGPFELIAVMLLLGVPAAALVLLLLRGKRLGGTQRPAFPVIAATDAHGPATYRVVGIDKTTRAPTAKSPSTPPAAPTRRSRRNWTASL